MPNRGSLVSKTDLIRWNDPRNLRTIPLNDFDQWGSNSFQLHECGYLANASGWNHDGLCNPYWRLYCNGKPGAHIEVNRRRIPLSPRRIVIIPENALFNARGRAGVPHLWIHFSPPLAIGLANDLLSIPLSAPLAGNIEELRHLLLSRVESRKSGKQRLFHACLAVLHCWFSSAPLQVREPLPASLTAVMETIERSLSGEISNPLLAARAGMSVEGFIRWFKERMGTTPARYVARRRVREACRLLSLGSRSIEEIAEAVGFANRHHFSRVFRHYTRRGPAQFRREQRRG